MEPSEDEGDDDDFDAEEEEPVKAAKKPVKKPVSPKKLSKLRPRNQQLSLPQNLSTSFVICCPCSTDRDDSWAAAKAAKLAKVLLPKGRNPFLMALPMLSLDWPSSSQGNSLPFLVKRLSTSRNVTEGESLTLPLCTFN